MPDDILFQTKPRIALDQLHAGLAARIASPNPSEFPDAVVAKSTVRNHVRARKRQMGLERRETFVPQSYSWAQEAQVD